MHKRGPRAGNQVREGIWVSPPRVAAHAPCVMGCRATQTHGRLPVLGDFTPRVDYAVSARERHAERPERGGPRARRVYSPRLLRPSRRWDIANAHPGRILFGSRSAGRSGKVQLSSIDARPRDVRTPVAFGSRRAHSHRRHMIARCPRLAAKRPTRELRLGRKSRRLQRVLGLGKPVGDPFRLGLGRCGRVGTPGMKRPSLGLKLELLLGGKSSWPTARARPAEA